MDEQINVNNVDKPMLLNIDNVTRSNNFYRKEIWTEKHLQLTVMSIPVRGEIGLELHNDTDQFLRIEYGLAAVYFGETKQNVKFIGNANQNYAILIPAGTWHNIINIGNVPLKLYSLYAPPHHPKGTVHKTKFDSDIAE